MFLQTTRRYNPKYRTLANHHRENFKFNICNNVFVFCGWSFHLGDGVREDIRDVLTPSLRRKGVGSALSWNRHGVTQRPFKTWSVQWFCYCFVTSRQWLAIVLLPRTYCSSGSNSHSHHRCFVWVRIKRLYLATKHSTGEEVTWRLPMPSESKIWLWFPRDSESEALCWRGPAAISESVSQQPFPISEPLWFYHRDREMATRVLPLKIGILHEGPHPSQILINECNTINK
jgi:hypothetical protein